MQVECIKCLAFDNRLLPNGCGQSHVTRFLKFVPMELMTLRTSNFMCWLIHRSTSARMRYYPRKGYVMCHVTSLNFGKQVIISR